MRLSVCIATFNEVNNIHIPLDSVREFADEIVIVDGGSEDRTREIAQSYGQKVRIIKTDNPPMFHINKQKALDAARGDWILQLDADEAVSAELQIEIQKILDSYEDDHSLPKAYWIPRKNLFLDRFLTKGGQYPDYTMRLYRRRSVRFPCRDVHENVEPQKNVKTAYLHSDLLHFADPDFSRYLHRWNRYTSLDALKIQEKNESLCFLCYFFAKPALTFFLMYFRHLGFVDGFAGFVFALFSALRYPVIYIKVYALTHPFVFSPDSPTGK